MSSDILLQGKQSEQLTALFESEIFDKANGNAGVFFLASLIGIYESKVEEAGSGGNELNISRTYLNNPNRHNFRYVLNTFENLEKKFNGIDQSMTQIFLDEQGLNNSDKFQLIKNHGYAGLDILNEYFLSKNVISDNLDVVTMIEKDLFTVEELDQIKIISNPIVEESIDELLYNE